MNSNLLIKCATIIVVVAIICLAGCTAYRYKAFKDGGYEDGALPGQAQTGWVKPNGH